jgi:hypothetical protein
LARSSRAYQLIETVTDRRKKECVDPERNGVTMSEGVEGGPGPPLESKFTAVGATRHPWGSQKNNKMGLVRHQDLIMHRVCIIVHISLLLTLMIVIVNNVLFDYLFQELNHMAAKNHLHSSSDVQEVASSTETSEIIFCGFKLPLLPSR